MAFGKLYSAYDDLRTRKGAMFFFILGFVFLVLTLLQFGFHLLTPANDLAGILVAVTMLCFGFGGILYFFSRMFARLAEIADEIEKDESLREEYEEDEFPPEGSSEDSAKQG